MPNGYNKMSTMTGTQKKLLKKMSHEIGGSQYDVTQSPQYQQSLQELNGVSNYAQDLMSPNSQAYQNFAAPEMRQFNEEIMPGIAEQFAGVGGLSSSGFQQSASGAGAGLAERLAALRSGLQMQGAGLLSQLSQQRNQYALQPYEMLMNLANLNQNRYSTAMNANTKAMYAKRPTFGQQFIGAFATKAGEGFGGMFGPGNSSGGGGGAAMNTGGTGFAPGAQSQWVSQAAMAGA